MLSFCTLQMEGGVPGVVIPPVAVLLELIPVPSREVASVTTLHHLEMVHCPALDLPLQQHPATVPNVS